MTENTAKFQEACLEAEKQVVFLIRSLTSQPGQTNSSAISGAMAGIIDAMIQMRKPGMSVEEAAHRAATLAAEYAGQIVAADRAGEGPTIPVGMTN